MRAVVQRVTGASVTVDGETVGASERGLMVLLGVGAEDGPDDVTYMVNKISNLRIFEDSEEKMNLSLKDVGGQMLAVSQFTLYGDCRKGRRPAFTSAAPPAVAETLYEDFVTGIRQEGIRCETGTFQAHMMVRLENDGPVTLLIDSKKEF